MFSFDVGKFRGVFDRLDEFRTMLDMMHLLFNLRTKDIAQRSLSQKLERDYSHCFAIIFVQPQSFQTLNGVPLCLLLGLDVLNEPSHTAVSSMQVSVREDSFNVLTIFEDEAENCLDVVFRNVLCFVMTVLRLFSFLFLLDFFHRHL
jgi:hypothetical protein